MMTERCATSEAASEDTLKRQYERWWALPVGQKPPHVVARWYLAWT